MCCTIVYRTNNKVRIMEASKKTVLAGQSCDVCHDEVNGSQPPQKLRTDKVFCASALCTLDYTLKSSADAKREPFWRHFIDFYQEHVASSLSALAVARRYGQAFSTLTEHSVGCFRAVFTMLNKFYPVDGTVPVKKTSTTESEALERIVKVDVSDAKTSDSDRLGQCQEETMHDQIRQDFTWLRGHWGVQADEYLKPREELYWQFFPCLRKTSPLLWVNDVRCRTWFGFVTHVKLPR